MTQRCEQRRRQLGALSRQLGGAPILEKLGTLHRDRHDPRHGVTRSGLELATARRQDTDGARPDSDRGKRDRAGCRGHLPMAAVGPCPRVELDDADGTRQQVIQITMVQLWR